MASSLLISTGMIPTTGSTVVVRSVLPIGSFLPSLCLNHPYNKPTLVIACCSSVSKDVATSATDLKPVVERWPEYIPSKLPDKSYVRVFDTTLRDGEQAPGGALTPPQKLEIARQLAKLRVDIMEVGFPGSSEEELETVKTIAKTVGNEVDEETGYVPVISTLARSKHKDIEAAWKAVKYAKRPRIGIFTSTSDIHMKYKLKKTKEELIEMAVSSFRFAKSLGFNDIQFGCEDGGRSEKEFLCKIIGEVIKAGATTVCLADTVGINMPQEYGELVSYLKAKSNITQPHKTEYAAETNSELNKAPNQDKPNTIKPTHQKEKSTFSPAVNFLSNTNKVCAVQIAKRESSRKVLYSSYNRFAPLSSLNDNDKIATCRVMIV